MHRLSTLSAVLGLILGGTALAQCPPATLLPVEAPAGSELAPYSLDLSVNPAGSWSFEAIGLPTGLALDPGGMLSGSPDGPGQFEARVVATDAQGCVVAREYVFDVASCPSLAVGESVLLDASASAEFCVGSQTDVSEYLLMPVNATPDGSLSLTTTANGIIATIGPPQLVEEAAASGQLELPTQTAHVHAQPLAGRDFPASLAAPRLAQARPEGTSVPVVGELRDVQVAPGCGGSPDVRKAQVRSVVPGPVGQPGIYVLEEVVESPAGSGNWVPAVPGGFTQAYFDVLADAFTGSPPDVTADPDPGAPEPIARTAGRDTVTSYFGAPSDIDGNGGVFVFYTRAMNERSAPASSVVVPGAFELRDLQSTVDCPLSNQGEYVYLMVPDPTGAVNSNVRTLSFVYGNSTRWTMHFMSHLAMASTRLAQPAPTPEEAWLDEGLAWFAEELLFFNTSMGLAPGQNIAVTELTTGPNASRRVAAFNAYANLQFSSLRSFFLQNSSVAGMNGLRVGPLREVPFDLTGLAGHEELNLQQAVTATFLRYAVDRLGGDAAARVRSMVETNLTGTENLQAVLGADPRTWARDFAAGLYADDAVAGIDPAFQLRSWHHRSIFQALNGSYPLATQPLGNASPLSFEIAGGVSPRWQRFGIAAGAASAVVRVRGPGDATPPAEVSAVLLRTR